MTNHMFTKEQCSILARVQKTKKELYHKNLKKTGYNKFSNYKYFELGDFTGVVIDLLEKKGLASHFQFNSKKARLYIVDTKNGAYLRWTTDLKPNTQETVYKPKKTVDMGRKMKDNQTLQTYARRTLYLQALEIAEPNAIDAGGETNNKKVNSTNSSKKQEKPKAKDNLPRKRERDNNCTQENAKRHCERIIDKFLTYGEEIDDSKIKFAIERDLDMSNDLKLLVWEYYNANKSIKQGEAGNEK